MNLQRRYGELPPLVEAVIRYVKGREPGTLTMTRSLYDKFAVELPPTFRWQYGAAEGIEHYYLCGWLIMPLPEPEGPPRVDYYHIPCGTHLFWKEGQPYRSGDVPTGRGVTIVATGEPAVAGALLMCPACARSVNFDHRDLRYVRS